MGPCLCGDPACPSCGNPSLTALEIAEEKLMDAITEQQLSIFEYYFLIAAIPGLIAAYRVTSRTEIRERSVDDRMVIDQLTNALEDHNDNKT